MIQTRKTFQIISALALLAAGCSTAQVSSSRDSRAQEYEALKDSVVRYHDSSYFGPDKPWLFSDKGTDSYYKNFAESYCRASQPGGPRIAPNACETEFRNTVRSLLTETYFAADMTEINKSCARDPLICGDVQTVEVLFRDLHNASIRESKREKLATIEEWRHHEISDDDLESALHFQFKYSNGKLDVSLPTPSADDDDEDSSTTP